jgi:hypothetical protein
MFIICVPLCIYDMYIHSFSNSMKLIFFLLLMHVFSTLVVIRCLGIIPPSAL